jgi:hypothetical protein
MFVRSSAPRRRAAICEVILIAALRRIFPAPQLSSCAKY